MNFKTIFNWLLVTDIYGAMMSAAIVPIVVIALGITFDVFSTIMVFFTAFAVYSLNRYSDTEVDEINVPTRKKFSDKWGWIITTFALTGFFFVLSYAFIKNLPSFYVSLTVFSFGILYSFPVFPVWVKEWFDVSRLKDCWKIKNSLLGIANGSFVLIPVLNAHFPINATVVFLFVFIFIRFFIISTIFDLRDTEGDKKIELKTIPILLGKKKTVMLLHVLNVLLVIFAIIGLFFYNKISILFASLVFITCLFGLYYLYQVNKENADLRHLCSVVVDSDWLPASVISFIFIIFF